MKIKNPMRLVAWLAVFALLMLSAAAATLDEMYENGVVSDGNVRFGDARDGVVSDVSEPMPGEAHRIRNGFDSAMSDGGNDNATGSVTGDDFGLNDDNILMGRSGAESGSAASGTAAAGNADSTGTGSNTGMVWGIILAILVIIAVVVLVMLFMPKKRG